MALPEKLTFHSWQRSSLLNEASHSGARLGATLSLTMTDQADGNSAIGGIPYEFIGAADIAAIQRSAIKHLAPAPFAPDAEVTKWPHVDFWDADLPWRYTPRAVAGDTIAPWLVLLAGTVDELVVSGSTVTVASDAPLCPVDLLNDGHRWAHVQYDGVQTISRVLAARPDLPAKSECVAVLVPAFGSTGERIWVANGAGGVTRQFGPTGVLPVLYSWRFWTAEEGDFETLATALRIPPAGLTGVSTLRYRRAATPGADPLEAELQIRGAITSIKLPPDSPDYLATVQEVANDVAIITADVAPVDVPVLSMPAYGRPWLPDPKAFPTGWPRELNADPRNRGIAGLGVWMGVEGQDSLIDAAVQQAGALREAGQLVNQMAFGIGAAGSLWDRRLATDSAQRLRVLGLMMDRLVDETGVRALDRVSAMPSPFPPAFFSGAAQRIMRGRSGATRHLTGSAGGFDITLATKQVNQADPAPVKVPDGLLHIDHIAPTVPEDALGLDVDRIAALMRQITRALDDVTRAFRSKRDALIAAGMVEEIPAIRLQFGEEASAMVDAILAADGFPCGIGQMMEMILVGFSSGSADEFLGWALADEGIRERLIESIERELVRCYGWACEGEFGFFGEGYEVTIPCVDIVDKIPPPPPSLHQPIDPDGLSNGLVGLLDPRRPDSPGRRRLCARLENIDCTRLIPPEYPLGLDYPTWDLLRQHEKEWLLPGARSLPKDSITALQTNPAFVDAYMTGINAQFLAEMRWRDLAVERTCTPLRMFWGQVDYTTGDRRADIEPLQIWASATQEAIGSLAHQTIAPDDPANTTGSRLVIAFHTDLFRRYPATLVYLVRTQTGPNHDPDVVDPILKKTPALQPGPGVDPVVWRQTRTFLGPIFSGAIKPDLVFFTFDIAPSDLDGYWLVLDEPPSELRFRRDIGKIGIDAANHAVQNIDKPSRVAIDGKELRAMGMS